VRTAGHATRARASKLFLPVLLLLLAFGRTAAAEEPNPAAAGDAAKNDVPAAPPVYRAKAGSVELYLPATFRPRDGKYDVVLHFHGLAKVQESNVTQAKLNAAVVSVNLGVMADKYGAAFKDPSAFDRLLATTRRMVAASGRAEGAAIGRVALSAWSAGFASVGAILRDEKARSRVDAVLIADGLHAAYSDPRRRVIEESSLVKYVRLCEEASRGEKLFVLTHSSIPTPGYATVNEAVGAVLRRASFEKVAPTAASPRGMRSTYHVDRGDLHITGFEGRGVRDHLDHIWAMGETMFPLLAARWERSSASAVATR